MVYYQLSITQSGLQCPVIASIIEYRKNVSMCQEYVKTGTGNLKVDSNLVKSGVFALP